MTKETLTPWTLLCPAVFPMKARFKHDTVRQTGLLFEKHQRILLAQPCTRYVIMLLRGWSGGAKAESIFYDAMPAAVGAIAVTGKQPVARQAMAIEEQHAFAEPCRIQADIGVSENFLLRNPDGN